MKLCLHQTIIKIGLGASLLLLTPLSQAAGLFNLAKTEKQATRRLSIGMANAYYTDSAYQNNSLGVGATIKYGFIIKPRFILDIVTSFRPFFDHDKVLTQTVYGLSMSHGIWSSGRGDHSLYLGYGLLLQVVKPPDADYAGTAHDTQLAIGYENRLLDIPLFAELGYHLSTLRHPTATPMPLNYLSLDLGARILF